MRAPSGDAGLQVEALAAAAGAVDVRVVDVKGLFQSFGDEVEAGAVDECKGLRVDHQAGAVLFEDALAVAQVVGDLVGVGKTRAADVLDADAQPEPASALGDLFADLLGSGFGQCDGHGGSPRMAYRSTAVSRLPKVTGQVAEFSLTAT